MYSNILVAIALDHSPDSGKAIDVARLLADAGANTTALNVVEDIPAYVASQIPVDLLAKRRSEAETELKAELGGTKDIKAVVIGGHAGRAIIDYADSGEFDCVVIASHRPGLQDYFLGSTAHQVVRHAKCAVHVLR